MLYAVIDIGSSIVKYKIYKYDGREIEPTIIYDQRISLISYRKDDELTKEGLDLLLETLKKFKNYSEQLQVDKSYYVATASLRNINNSSEVLFTVKKELNIDIKILTGYEEAHHSFNSIKWINMPENEGILVDIGGGSSEVSVFEDCTPIEQKSVPIGVITIYQNYVSLLLPTKQEQDEIVKVIREKIREQNFSKTSKNYLYGIGKSIVTVKKLFKHMGLKIEENTLDIKDIDYLLNIFSSNTKERYQPLLLVDSERIHTIIPSLLVVKALSCEFNLKKLYVCDVTLQDGIILDLIDENKIRK